MDQACITTKEIIENGEPIYSILRDSDDEWQFFGKEEPDDDQIAVVSVDKIWKLYPDILQFCKGLEKGTCAFRNEVGSEWTVEKYE